jgi:hypothetical protein
MLFGCISNPRRSFENAHHASSVFGQEDAGLLYDLLVLYSTRKDSGHDDAHD